MKQKPKPRLVKPTPGFSPEYVLEQLRKFRLNKRLTKYTSEPCIISDRSGRQFIHIACHERVVKVLSRLHGIHYIVDDNWSNTKYVIEVEEENGD